MPGGANINDYNSYGLTMLHEAITKQDTQSALFLLQRQADANAKYVNCELKISLRDPVDLKNQWGTCSPRSTLWQISHVWKSGSLF